MKLEDILSADEIMTRRTPLMFVEWFESLLSSTKEIKDDEFKRPRKNFSVIWLGVKRRLGWGFGS